MHVEKKNSSLLIRLPIRYPDAPTEVRINGRFSKFKKSEDVNRIRDPLKNYYKGRSNFEETKRFTRVWNVKNVRV